MVTILRNAFSRSLKKYPLPTNTTVYATLYTAAELSQQTYNKYYTPEKPDYNFKHAARIVAVGSTIYAPTLYFWYKFLDKKFVGTTTKIVLTKVAVDQFLMTPVLLASFYIVMATVERRENLFEELREKYWKTFIANQSFWIPTQTVNFFFIPSHLRIVYVACASFVWINILCYIKRQKLHGKIQEVK